MLKRYQVVTEIEFEPDDLFSVIAPNHHSALAKVGRKYSICQGEGLVNDELGNFGLTSVRELSEDELTDKDKVYSLSACQTETISVIVEAESPTEAVKIAHAWLDVSHADDYENNPRIKSFSRVMTGFRWEIDTDKPEMSTKGYVDGDNGSGFSVFASK